MSQLMNKTQWDTLCWIEEYYLKKEEFPSMSKMIKGTGLDRVTLIEALSSPILQQALERRGIPFEVEEERLTPLQVAYLNLAFNVADTRSHTAKLKALGINPNTYKGWTRQKHFMEAMKNQGERLFGENTSHVIKSLTDKAIEGDPQAQKLYLAMAGRWDSAKTVEQTNIRFLLEKVLECIQTHVRDPEILQAIATDLGAISAPTQRELN